MTELNDQLKALLGQFQGTNSPAVDGWDKPKQATGKAQILGVLIPVSIDTEIGKVRTYLQFGAEHAASPSALLSLIEQLANAGLPIDAWQKQESNSDSWGNNGKSVGGWGNNKGYKRRW